MGCPRAQARGYTLVELIVVMVLMGVLASVALPRLTDRRALQERGFLDQVRTLLQHSHKIATAQRRGTCVLLTPTTVSAYYDSGTGCSAASVPLNTPSSTDPLTIAVPSGVVLGGAGQVRFAATGRPNPDIDHVITVGGNTYTVSRETGIVY